MRINVVKFKRIALLVFLITWVINKGFAIVECRNLVVLDITNTLDGETTPQDWAIGVAKQLYGACRGVALASLFGAVILLGLAFIVPSLTLKNILISWGVMSVLGAVIFVIFLFSLKQIMLLITGWIDPKAQEALSDAFSQLEGES